MPTGVPYATTIGFYSYLEEAFIGSLGNWLDSQTWGIGVGTNHCNRVARLE